MGNDMRNDMGNDSILVIDDYDVLVDDEMERICLRFDADMSRLRRPTAVVIDVPGAPVTLEDEQGVVVEFRRPVSEEDFVVLSFGGVIHLMPVDPATEDVQEVVPVLVQNRVHVLSREARQ